MKSLYLRIWLTVVAALALFALVSGWMWQRHLEQERVRLEAVASERLQAWVEVLQRALPAADAPAEDQAQAVRDWSARLRVPMALDSAAGQRIATTDNYQRREQQGRLNATAVPLEDGRTLWLARRPWRAMLAPEEAAYGLRLPDPLGGGPVGLRLPAPPGLRGTLGMPPLDHDHDRPPRGGPDTPPRGGEPGNLLSLPYGLPRAVAPLLLVGVLFIAVAAGAYPVVRRLTRRLEALTRGVEAFGRGNLAQRVDDAGRDEVAAVSTAFNHAAERIETLVRSHQSLLANASHELRSPLARLKMAVAMYPDMPPVQQEALRREIDTNVAELDALVEEVLLASRLDGHQALALDDRVDLLGIAAEEAARAGCELAPDEAHPAPLVMGSERLLRRALRNLLENARRYGGSEVTVVVAAGAAGGAVLRVCDRGPGVPEDLRERIFEPFYRLPGHAEREGGVGLGLSLVRQIAQRHGGQVLCLARAGGGSCFELSLPSQG